ncbi:aminoacyl-tRNA hydrolase [Candidatus Shapirobacteria bacterium CG09_land_8_20_14_0_10_39_12]|uniref:Peptidyl-tRNA hydrolase n=1 Tax=Candidatus Shapirobacteria bacterium CG09_land_8_20_14_0_10_39_12 TaxID=1974885 RepID=A0A2H0WQ17_9BACT|nr:MAG: aminoacyl-tRNA hydrolase [Candidatus Shapirobacteria bacterium CG09_land_8_20_14_0_10_39_12]
MILIVGLGNPGEKYENTRHNIGFMVVDHFLKKMTSVGESIWEKELKFNCFLAKAGKEVFMAKPNSFMNASGKVVQKLLNFYKISPFALYVVHDDLDLPLGKIKISYGRGSAGHKGVESIIEQIKSNNFVRLRVGIGSDKKIDEEKYVISDFEKNEAGKLKQAVKKAVEALEFILKKGAEKAANRYN